jgi:outer membrane biosynthesis protein TonB
MKTMKHIPSRLLVSVVLPLLSYQAIATGTTVVSSPRALYIQEGDAAAPLGKLNVSPGVMAGRCVTMVSPTYPVTEGESPVAATVIVRAVIWKSGNVSPMRVISGPVSLQSEAMNTVRLWHYHPFSRDGEPLDVTTDITVSFDPGKPGGMVTHPRH